MKIFDKNESYIISPDNRIYEYLLYSDFVFDQKKIFFCNDFSKIDKENNQVILDLKYLEKFNDYKFQNYSLNIIIILWNAYIDYLINEKQIKILKEKFKNLKILSPSNFSFEKNYFLPLDNLHLANKSTLNEIKGINYLKKIKYNFPSIFSIYNFLKYIPRSLSYLSEKIVFVGLGNDKDILKQLNYVLKSSFTSIEFKEWSEFLLKEYNIKNYFFDQNSFKKIKNFNMRLDEKYYIVNLIVRNLLLNYLKNFTIFSHKTNSNDAFELLKTNFYKKIIHLDLGSQCGNARNNVRSVLLHRFYNSRHIRLNFFDYNTTYNSENFIIRLESIKIFFDNLYKFKNYKCSVKELTNKMMEVNEFL